MSARSTFRLAAVLRVRHLQEELARTAVGAATAAADRADAHARAYEQRVLLLGAPAGGAGQDFSAQVAGRLALARDTAQARATATSAAGAVDDAVRWWSEAAARVRALERLQEAHAAAARAAEEAAAQTVMDDLAAAAWQRAAAARTRSPRRTEEAPCPA